MLEQLHSNVLEATVTHPNVIFYLANSPQPKKYSADNNKKQKKQQGAKEIFWISIFQTQCWLVCSTTKHFVFARIISVKFLWGQCFMNVAQEVELVCQPHLKRAVF